MHVRDGGVWKTATPEVRDGGVWKPHDGYVKDGGVWKQYHSNINYPVTASATTIYETGRIGSPNSVTFTITTTGLSNGDQITYTVVAASGSDWTTDDYNISSGKPSGNLTISNNQASFQLYLTASSNDTGESTEYFYITVHQGASAQATPVVGTSPTITVVNESCPWGFLGFPQWC